MNPRQRARDLVRLAADERTPEKERLVAAVKACGLIEEHGLLDSPLDSLGDMIKGEQETIDAFTKIRDVATDPDLLGALKSIAKRFKGAKETVRGRRSRRR